MPTLREDGRMNVLPPPLFEEISAAESCWRYLCAMFGYWQRPVNRLQAAKRELQNLLIQYASSSATDSHSSSRIFRTSAPDSGLDLSDLHDSLDRARSLRALWHLRGPVYSVISIANSQQVAEEARLKMDAHFPCVCIKK